MIDIYGHNIGGIADKSGEIYNRDLTGGEFTISDLYIKIKSDITAIKEAKIIINAIEYDAEITTDGNTQLLTFFENTPVTIFNVNKMEDMDTHNYIYTFILTTTDLETFNVHRNITYTFNRYSDIGDINGDGQHNILDVVALTDSIIAGNCTDIEDGYPCDLNGDGGYNILDIVSLANYILSK
mgnify:CR=1 FL=1